MRSETKGLWLIGSALFLCANPTKAEAIEPSSCERWAAIPAMKSSQVELIASLEINGSLEAYIDRRGRLVRGYFSSDSRFRIGIWNLPHGTRPDMVPFSVTKGKRLLFVSHSDPYDRVEVTGGYFGYPSRVPQLVCKVVDGTLSTIWRDPTDTEITPPTREPDAASREARESGRPVTKEAHPHDHDPFAITELLKRDPKSTRRGSRPPDIDDAGADESIAWARPPSVSEEGATPVRKICRSDMKPIVVPWNLHAASVPEAGGLPVGLRNKRTDVRLFDFLEIGSTSVARNAFVDMRSSANLLTAFTQVGKPTTEHIDGKKIVVIPVAIPGVDLNRSAKESNSSTRMDVPLKFLVVGAAEEIAISGLEKLGKELANYPKFSVQPQIEWHPVAASGELLNPVKFDSFKALVIAAQSRSNPGFFITLGEKEFAVFTEKLQAVLVNRREAVDRVIWIKSAYKLGPTAPVHIQNLIDAAAYSASIPKTASGLPEKWLLVLSASMPGFSVNYIKEPVYSNQVGEVLMETSAEGPSRRLLSDPLALARSLGGLAVLRSRTIESRPISAARPAVNASEIFSETGYLLSRATIERLDATLNQLISIWDDTGNVTGTAGPVLLTLSGKEDASVADVLRDLLPLANSLVPGMPAKSLMLMNERERHAAKAFVENLARKTANLMRREPRSGACDLIYVTGTHLGDE